MEILEKLALLGGKPVRKQPLASYNMLGRYETMAALRVLRSRKFSGFHGTYDDRFWGGPFVRAFEKDFGKYFGVKYAVSYNSATTALQGAVAACGIGPGDEVITSPYTMAATASAVLLNGAVPVFADLDPRTFTVDPASVKKLISKKTRAILAVNLFGGSCDFDALKALAKKHNLFIIEDNAQAIGATYKKKYLGTIGDIGVFSFNVHKLLQSGEGGVLVTNDKKLALRAQLVRNHGEVAADTIYQQSGVFEPVVGSNYRMTEVHAAIAHAQLKRIKKLIKDRIAIVNYLTKKLKNISWLTTPYLIPDSKHVYFLYALLFDRAKAGICRETFVKAMAAEGVPVTAGYVDPTYYLELFQRKRMYPNSAFPFDRSPEVSYKKGICPVVERLQNSDLMLLNIIHHAPRSKADVDDIARAFQKVDANLDKLKDYERNKKS